jgi:hypothetical protein
MPRQKKQSSREIKFLFLAFLVFVLILLSIGVFKVIKDMTADFNPTASNQQAETLKEKGQNFPSDFPLFPGAVLVDSSEIDSAQGKGFSIIWETDNPSPEVADYYRVQLAENGWLITSSFEEEESFTFTFEKEKVRGFLGLTVNNGKTVVSVTIGVNK